MGENRRNFKTIFIVVGLLISLGVILLVGDRVYNLLAKAGGNVEPQNVQITQITANSASITFATAKAVQTLVEYGTNATNLTLFASDTADATDHKIALSLLTPTTTYYFHIKIGGKTYDNSGLPWTFTTSGGIQPQNISPSRGIANPLLSPTVSSGPAASPSGTKINCSEVSKRIGATRNPASPNYDPKYDLNSDGIINAADVILCGKQ